MVINLRDIQKAERETHIFVRPGEKTCLVFTSDFRLSQRLQKAGFIVDEEEDNSYGLNYRMPVGTVFRPLIRGR
jgi:hypothetical protein